MSVERVDYYTEDEYRQAKQAELDSQQEQAEIQRVMEKDMLIDHLIKENTELLSVAQSILDQAQPISNNDYENFAVISTLLYDLEKVVKKSKG